MAEGSAILYEKTGPLLLFILALAEGLQAKQVTGEQGFDSIEVDLGKLSEPADNLQKLMYIAA